jgi:hypothetical protein
MREVSWSRLKPCSGRYTQIHFDRQFEQINKLGGETARKIPTPNYGDDTL